MTKEFKIHDSVYHEIYGEGKILVNSSLKYTLVRFHNFDRSVNVSTLKKIK